MIFAILLNLMLPALAFAQDATFRDLKYYGDLSAAIYCSDESLRFQSCQYCWPLPSISHRKVFDQQGTRAFTGIDVARKSIVVVIRGTNVMDLRNIFSDITIFPIALPGFDGVQVHSGFYQYWNVAKQAIFMEVQRLSKENPDYQIEIIGHSLGGAAAAIAAVEAKYGFLKSKKVSLITLGQPRTGNAAFASLVMNAKFEKLYRIVNARDPIPHVPARDEDLPAIPVLQKYGFVHHGQEVLVENGKIRFCADAKGEDETCSRRFYKWDFDPLMIAANFLDHSTYFRDLTDLCD